MAVTYQLQITFQQQITFHRAIKYRIHDKRLSDGARTYIMQNTGCSRKLYNLYVEDLYDKLEKLNFVNGEIPKSIKVPSYKEFTEKYSYMKDVDSLTLANAKIDFQNAIKHYNEQCDHVSYTKGALRRYASGKEPLSFRGLKGMPKFHSKSRGDISFRTNCQYPKEGNSLKNPTIRLDQENKILHIPKCEQDLPLIIHQRIPEDAVIGNVTISMELDGSLYASIEYTYTRTINQSLQDAANTSDMSILEGLKFLGLDYSQQNFYVDSEGRIANFPHFYTAAEEKLAKLQKQLARMEYDEKTHTGSNNYNKTLAKIRKLSCHIANQRKDYLQKLSTELVNNYDVIVCEDINLRAMGECLSLGKNLHDNGFGMFRTMLAYKLRAKGSCLVKVDKFYPSTKTCSVCGHKNSELTLSDREWDCPNCGTHLDRDHNAAINIREEGKRIFLDSLKATMEKEQKAAKEAARRKASRGRKSKSA